MMKIFAIIGLILMFWCHQSQHHIFLLINTTPLGLASEEYIPVGAETNSKSTVEVKEGNEAVVVGSQTIKSDNVNVNVEPTSSQFVETVQNVEGSGVPAPTSKEEPLPPVEIPGESQKSQEPDKSQSEVHDAEKSSDTSADKVVEPAANKDVHTESRPESTAKVSEDLSEVVNVVPASNSSAPVEDSSDNNQTNEQGAPVPEQSASGSPVVPNLVSLPPKEEEPIPSFMEWTHQKLHETNSAPGANGNGHTNGNTNGNKNSNTAGSQQNKSTQATQGSDDKGRKGNNAKNFASPDCGAKVIQSNAESQNPNGVLSGSTDEYMLNKCGTSTWFIIELCEPLKIEKVSLGNLELFSSSPKDIEIGISDRYPTREWTKLGPFTLLDFRAIHPIELPATNASTFGKFLKVNVLSHWGSEHYCPLSLIKVNGISEYEVLESENTHQEEIDGADKEENAVYEEPVIVQHDGAATTTDTDKSVFGSAKDAVINIVKKAAQVLAKSDNTKDASQLGVSPQSSCRSLLQCLPSYEAQFREHVLSLLSCNFSDLLPFLSKNSPWCGWDYCHSLFNRHSIGLPWQPEGFYASIFGGPSVLHALCNYHKPLSKETCDAFFLHTATASPNEPGVPAEGYINESLKSPPLTVGSGTSSEPPKETENFIIVKEPVAEVVKPEITDAPSPVEVNNGGQNGEAVKVPQQAKESSPVIEPISNGNNGEVHQNTAPPTLPPVTTSTPGNGNAEDTNGNIAPSSQQQPHVPGQQQQQQKESVFVRLSNRIKTLERNQSLTASYLEELSRRFKKQNEENYHINEGTRNFINESRIKFKTLEDLYKFELRSLRRNTDEIRERLFNVQLQRSVLILLCLMQFTGLVCAYIWVRNRFNQFENRLQTPPQQHLHTILPSPSRPYTLSHRAQSSSCPDSPQHNIMLGRKRINSDASIGSSLSSFDKSKKIKKKKKKLADLKPLTLKAAGPASAPLEYHNKPEGVFKFDSPKSSSSAYNLSSVLSSSNFKENIKPEPKSDSEINTERKPLLFGGDATSIRSGAGSPSRPASLSTKVEPPFSMISSTGAIFYPDHGVSTSSRFAILASPGPAPPGKPSNLKRSGSLTSLDDRSSISSLGEKTGIQCILNGHGNNGDSQSQGSNGSGKKRKNKGFKAFMPKIFDR